MSATQPTLDVIHFLSGVIDPAARSVCIKRRSIEISSHTIPQTHSPRVCVCSVVINRSAVIRISRVWWIARVTLSVQGKSAEQQNTRAEESLHKQIAHGNYLSIAGNMGCRNTLAERSCI